jgi:hypothetical protein
MVRANNLSNAHGKEEEKGLYLVMPRRDNSILIDPRQIYRLGGFVDSTHRYLTSQEVVPDA